jgi:hypothetical protein
VGGADDVVTDSVLADVVVIATLVVGVRVETDALVADAPEDPQPVSEASMPRPAITAAGRPPSRLSLGPSPPCWVSDSAVATAAKHICRAHGMWGWRVASLAWDDRVVVSSEMTPGRR